MYETFTSVLGNILGNTEKNQREREREREMDYLRMDSFSEKIECGIQQNRL